MSMISSALMSATVVGAAVAGVAYMPEITDGVKEFAGEGQISDLAEKVGEFFEKNLSTHLKTAGESIGETVMPGEQAPGDINGKLWAIMSAAIGAAGLGGILGANINGSEEPAPGHLAGGPQNGGQGRG